MKAILLTILLMFCSVVQAERVFYVPDQKFVIITHQDATIYDVAALLDIPVMDVELKVIPITTGSIKLVPGSVVYYTSLKNQVDREEIE